jgi:hypothetical protein
MAAPFMNGLLNVSRGRLLKFTANDAPVSGVITDSKPGGLYVFVEVETEADIPAGAHLKVPDVPEAGGCGLAKPNTVNGRARVILEVFTTCVDTSTIGK